MTNAEITEGIDELSVIGAAKFLNDTDTHANLINTSGGNSGELQELINAFKELNSEDKETVCGDLELNIVRPTKYPEGEPG